MIEAASILVLVTGAALVLGFGVGTRAGPLARAATDSAVVGTASEVLGRLDLPATEILRLQVSTATAYCLLYLFGLVSIAAFTTQIAPALLRINLRDEAAALAIRLGAPADAGQQLDALPGFVGGAFWAGPSAGMTLDDFDHSRNRTVLIERIRHGGDLVDPPSTETLQEDVLLILHGRRNAVIAGTQAVGPEQPVPPEVSVPMARRDLLVNRR